MSLNILIGPSGHGKTYSLYRQIIDAATANPDKKYILIVPEQSSLTAQKQMVRMHENHGVFNIDVLTFGRLCFRVFEELGVELGEAINDTGKNLIVRKVLDGIKKDFRIIKSTKKQGFISEMKSMISELKQYGITPAQLEEVIASINEDRLREKLNDVLMVYKSFEEYIAGNYQTVEDRPELLYDIIDRSELIKGSEVAFDGFTGFTPVQYRLIEKILDQASNVTVTGCISNDSTYNHIVGEEDLFNLTKQMISRLGRIADNHQVEMHVKKVETDTANYRFKNAKELAFLEENIFRYNKNKFDGPVKNIEIFNLGNYAEEVQFTASQILKEVKNNHYRYRDIAIITNDNDLYGDEIERVFKESNIPFFKDSKRSLIGNPMVEYIRGILEILSLNFSYESVFRVLKNGLCDIDKNQVDKFENYILAFGIRGEKKYREKFIRKYPGKTKDNETIEAVRVAFVEKIDSYINEMNNGDNTVASYVSGIYNFLVKEEIYSKMNALADEITDDAKAEEIRKSYNQVIELLETLHSLLGTEKMSIKEFAEILDAGFEEVKVGLIPPSIDCVLICDLERSRLDNPKLLFVLGVNEGIIPKTSTSHGILSEIERKTLSELVELSPSPREKVFIQNYYLYLNLTKPSDKLYLTYHSMDEACREARESRVIKMLCNLFPKLKVKNKAFLGTEDFLTNPRNSMHILADFTKLEFTDDSYYALINYMMSKEEYRDKILDILGALEKAFKDNRLSAIAAHNLYTDILRSSVTRIEKFAECAFRHFANYGLELEERKVYELNNADLGNVFHSALEAIGKELEKQKRTFADLSDEERHEITLKTVEKVSTDYKDSYFNDSATNAYQKKRIAAIVERTVWALGKQLGVSEFKPWRLEAGFERDFEDMTITGKIDRIDIAKEEGLTHVKIIDYKSGNKKFDMQRIYAGLDLQLMVYLYDAMDKIFKSEGGSVIAAAAFYNRIDDPIVEMKNPEEDYESKLLKELRPDGLVGEDSIDLLHKNLQGYSLYIPVKINKDGGIGEKDSKTATDYQLKGLADYAVDKMQELVTEIKEGHIECNPYEKSCDYCPYGNICGFDIMKTDSYRDLNKYDKDNVWKNFGLEESTDGDDQ